MSPPQWLSFAAPLTPPALLSKIILAEGFTADRHGKFTVHAGVLRPVELLAYGHGRLFRPLSTGRSIRACFEFGLRRREALLCRAERPPAGF
jgi:hypothetical protein